MNNLVSDASVFHIHKSKLFDRFSDANFEVNPFKAEFKQFIGFEFDFIYRESFFSGLKQFLSKVRSNTVIFYTLDPSPEEYFFKRYKKYSVFEMSSIATDEELNAVMVQDPGENTADSIVTSSDEIAWFSNSNKWAILGSRDWEIAVVGFINAEIQKQFIESFSVEAQTMFTTVEQQTLMLDEMLSFSETTKAAYKKLAENYRNRV